MIERSRRSTLNFVTHFRSSSHTLHRLITIQLRQSAGGVKCRSQRSYCYARLWSFRCDVRYSREEALSEAVTTLSVQKLMALGAILRGGALCGVLDITAAFVVYGYFGAKPLPLLQGIASGLLGPRAFDGGLPTALLGLCLHFFIALTATCVYVFLSRWVSLLGQYVYVSGPLYGVAVYFFMQYIVIPLSAFRKRPFSLKGMIIGIVIHIFCVGLPISVTARRCLHT